MHNYQAPPTFKHGRYITKKVLGAGTYGQVIRCADQATGEDVAVKVAQRDPAYRRAAMSEINALYALRNNADSVNILDTFEDNGHVCIVTELLHKNLYEVLRARQFGPLSLEEVRSISSHLFAALGALHREGFMHCDIKPENVMLRRPDPPQSHTYTAESRRYGYSRGSGSSNTGAAAAAGAGASSPEPEVNFELTTLIDFGAVRQFHDNTYYDVQSLWYRAPEVLCGLPYTTSIDSWSVGCVLFELYTGKPLFPGENVQDQLTRIVQMIGRPSDEALIKGANVSSLYIPNSHITRDNAMANIEHFMRSCRNQRLTRAHKAAPPTTSIFGTAVSPAGATNADGLDHYTNIQQAAEDMLVHLMTELLHPDERRRLSCEDALHHPFFAMSLQEECRYTPAAPTPAVMLAQRSPPSQGYYSASNLNSSFAGAMQRASTVNSASPVGYAQTQAGSSFFSATVLQQQQLQQLQQSRMASAMSGSPVNTLSYSGSQQSDMLAATPVYLDSVQNVLQQQQQQQQQQQMVPMMLSTPLSYHAAHQHANNNTNNGMAMQQQQQQQAAITPLGISMQSDNSLGYAQNGSSAGVPSGPMAKAQAQQPLYVVQQQQQQHPQPLGATTLAEASYQSQQPRESETYTMTPSGLVYLAHPSGAVANAVYPMFQPSPYATEVEQVQVQQQQQQTSNGAYYHTFTAATQQQQQQHTQHISALGMAQDATQGSLVFCHVAMPMMHTPNSVMVSQ